MTTMLATTTIEAPMGVLRLYARGGALTGLYFDAHRPAPRVAPGAIERADEPILVSAREQLDAYFAGARTRFELPIAFEHGTVFERAVWTALGAIPHGERVSYAELAQRIARPRAVRAVGAANARNPLSIVLPCHRVVGARGALTGYAGGLARKAWLLDHESRVARSSVARE